MILGCTSVPETPPPKTTPNCTVPELGWLPTIKGAELQNLDPIVYWLLEEREGRLTDWALGMEAQLIKLCE